MNKKEVKIVFYNKDTKYIDLDFPEDLDIGDIKAIYIHRNDKENKLLRLYNSMKTNEQDSFIKIVYINNKPILYDPSIHINLKVYNIGIEKAKDLKLI